MEDAFQLAPRRRDPNDVFTMKINRKNAAVRKPLFGIQGSLRRNHDLLRSPARRFSQDHRLTTLRRHINEVAAVRRPDRVPVWNINIWRKRRKNTGREFK